MKTQIQIRSRKCQNRLRQASLRRTMPSRPNFSTWWIMMASHSRPKVTCRPWVATRVKYADR
ncbi:hypothetical protein D3C72_2516160 [compost metagenome]